MLEKISEAFSLLLRHFVLFSAIILTLWLPGNSLVNFLDQPTEDDDWRIFKIAFRIEQFFGPICVAAMIDALNEIKHGRAPGYFRSMGAGLRGWFPLFWANIVSGFCILLGIIALIVPGIMLLVWFALVPAIVVLERPGAVPALKRSRELTVGRRWPIFWACVLIIGFVIFCSILFYLPQIFFESLDTKPVTIAIDCAINILASLPTIVAFLYYWEATHPDPTDPPPTIANPDQYPADPDQYPATPQYLAPPEP